MAGVKSIKKFYNWSRKCSMNNINFRIQLLGYFGFYDECV